MKWKNINYDIIQPINRAECVPIVEENAWVIFVPLK